VTEGRDVVVRDDPEALRYELLVDGEHAGELRYREGRGAIALVHTEVEPAYEGHGLAGRLVAGALDDIRARGLRVIAVCPFARAYIQRHPEYDDLTGRGRGR
jgi:uncharacterized protein